eukprot:gene20647-31818_t
MTVVPSEPSGDARAVQRTKLKEFLTFSRVLPTKRKNRVTPVQATAMLLQSKALQECQLRGAPEPHADAAQPTRLAPFEQRRDLFQPIFRAPSAEGPPAGGGSRQQARTPEDQRGGGSRQRVPPRGGAETAGSGVAANDGRMPALLQLLQQPGLSDRPAAGEPAHGRRRNLFEGVPSFRRCPLASPNSLFVEETAQRRRRDGGPAREHPAHSGRGSQGGELAVGNSSGPRLASPGARDARAAAAGQRCREGECRRPVDSPAITTTATGESPVRYSSGGSGLRSASPDDCDARAARPRCRGPVEDGGRPPTASPTIAAAAAPTVGEHQGHSRSNGLRAASAASDSDDHRRGTPISTTGGDYPVHGGERRNQVESRSNELRLGSAGEQGVPAGRRQVRSQVDARRNEPGSGSVGECPAPHEGGRRHVVDLLDRFVNDRAKRTLRISRIVSRAVATCLGPPDECARVLGAAEALPTLRSAEPSLPTLSTIAPLPPVLSPSSKRPQRHPPGPHQPPSGPPAHIAPGGRTSASSSPDDGPLPQQLAADPSCPDTELPPAGAAAELDRQQPADAGETPRPGVRQVQRQGLPSTIEPDVSPPRDGAATMPVPVTRKNSREKAESLSGKVGANQERSTRLLGASTARVAAAMRAKDAHSLCSETWLDKFRRVALRPYLASLEPAVSCPLSPRDASLRGPSGGKGAFVLKDSAQLGSLRRCTTAP